jgi:hypothetical protein
MTSTRSSPRGDSSDLTPVDWLTLHEQVESSLSSIELDLTERTITQRQRRTLTKRLADSLTDIDRLERALTLYSTNPIKHKIGDGELQRRKSLITQLRSYQSRLSDDLTPSTSTSRRTRPTPHTPLNEDPTTSTLTNSQLYHQQQVTIEQQDQKLDSILQGVTTLKALSTDIHQELDLHSGLLDEVGEGVEHAKEGMKANTRRIGEVERKDKGWLAVICMLIWVVLIVVLLASDVFCPLFALMGSQCGGHNQHTTTPVNGTWGFVNG